MKPKADLMIGRLQKLAIDYNRSDKYRPAVLEYIRLTMKRFDWEGHPVEGLSPVQVMRYIKTLPRYR
jgi:hypothetical protein